MKIECESGIRSAVARIGDGHQIGCACGGVWCFAGDETATGCGIIGRDGGGGA